MLVDERGWLTEREFTEVLALAQFLPGPNIVNVTIIVGRKFRGVAGAFAASIGLMLMPMIIVLILATVYERFAQIATVRAAVHGVSAAAAGLILAMGFRIARPLRTVPWQIAIAAVVFVAVGVARLPLLWVIAVLAPLSTFIAWRARR
jgi:chromate transporter